MAKLDAQAQARMEQLLEEFEEELARSNYSRNTKNVRRGYLRQFVAWLGGTWSPLDYDGTLTP